MLRTFLDDGEHDWTVDLINAWVAERVFEDLALPTGAYRIITELLGVEEIELARRAYRTKLSNDVMQYRESQLPALLKSLAHQQDETDLAVAIPAQIASPMLTTKTGETLEGAHNQDESQNQLTGDEKRIYSGPASDPPPKERQHAMLVCG